MRSLLTVAAGVALARAASDGTVGASVDSHGITHLYGNSFGRPGYNETYDYIVIGGGNAGNTIAARLAQDPANYTVAVLEAGSFYELLDGNRTQIPGYNYVNTITFPLGTASTPTLWGLATEPQEGFGRRSEFYAQGQTFGGSTAANYMGYQRATAGTFDQWAQLVDDSFWSWENVYPAYKKSTTFQPPDYTKIDRSINITYDPAAYSPAGGPLHVSYGNYQGPYSNSLDAAMAASGLEPIAGFNSGKLLGYGTATATIDTRYATRDTSESSFLQEAAQQTSIKIYPQAIATKIVFNDQKVATGVEVQSNVVTANLKYLLTARKEVIVSAGVWHSPQLLMVSGVGPAETLQTHGIDVVADLPGVGQNEMDQPVVSLFLNLTVPTNTQLQVNNPNVMGPAIAQYLDNRSGPLSGFGTGHGIGFEKFPASLRANFSKSTLEFLSTYPADWPEAEYLALENVPVEFVPITPYDNFIIFSAVMLAFESKGNMTISSSSILDAPIISPNWLTTDADVEQVHAAFLRLREISSHWSAVQSEVLPGPTIINKTAILAYVQEHGSSIYHGSSTCRMGLKNDTEAVVDSRARVYGVSGLRVVDASSFPNSPPGHPMSTVYMFAEKIAESILSGNEVKE